MNREFVYNHQGTQPSTWSRITRILNRWIWGMLCCGIPGVPCYFCTCCQRMDDVALQRDRSRINQSTATADRMSRPHRPHAPRSRKSTPEMLSAVRCALSQLQGEPAPPVTRADDLQTPEPG
ncbi:uncharacterized protein LOC113510982 [Galleria mellonella]|uniref:Uncharacterized protein LOC113510982 n=1 Tax=Galleria mellonella TaxID=7137 RepID=A0A6J1WJ82_GALME|nr:uncharacterized protein LOC113510982 [Galleria mellonella]